MSRPLRFTLQTAVIVSICLFMFELLSIFFVNQNSWPGSTPNYHLSTIAPRFWTDINEHFGVWKEAHSTFHHRKSCFDVVNRANSFGARDVERGLKSTRDRTVVLGDSFVEGYGVKISDRFTNLLENATGREHLNFGAGGHFGPLQYQLLYKTLASKFDHSHVLVAVFPNNDFRDDSLKYGKKHHYDRYRPYYVRNGKGYDVIYFLDYLPSEETILSSLSSPHFFRHVLREFTASYHVAKFIYYRFSDDDLFNRPYSGYNDYTIAELDKLKKSLLEINKYADKDGGKMTIVLIPSLADFMRFSGTAENELGSELGKWALANNIYFIDLLPVMADKAKGNFHEYFLSCDGHWSSFGHKAAAEILLDSLSYTKLSVKDNDVHSR